MRDFNHRIQIRPEHVSGFLASLPPLLDDMGTVFAIHAHENGPFVYVITDHEMIWPPHWLLPST